MTMHKGLDPRDNIVIMNVSRKERGRGLASTQDSIDALIQRLKDYIKFAKEDWLQPPEKIQKKKQA